MADIVPLRQDTPQPSLDEVAAAYPKQIGMHYLYRAYASGMVPVGLADLLAAFRRYTKHIQSRRVELQYVLGIRKYLEDRHWNDVYELPESAKPILDYDGEAQKRELMQRKADGGSKFAADWLKANGPAKV